MLCRLRGSGGVLHRLQVDHKSCAFAWTVTEGTDRPPMHLHNRLGDRQPQPQSFTLSANLREGVKNLLELFGLNSYASVGDLDLQRFRFGVKCSDRDRTSRWRKFR